MSIFSSLPVNKPKLTPFRLGHSVKFTTQFGFEQPTLCEKCVPGDVILDQVAHRIDFAPLTSRLLQEFRVKSESFFVPTRILWKGFEDFFVEEENEIVHPYIRPLLMYNMIYGHSSNAYWPSSCNSTTIAANMFGPRGLLWAIYGALPLGTGTETKLDALPLFAYFTIMREYYLDENLQSDFIDVLDPAIFLSYYQSNSGDMSSYFVALLLRLIRYQITGVFAPLSEQPSTITSTIPASTVYQYALGFVFRNYPKDYFVGALPWKQKGNTVYIPSSARSEVQFYIQNDADTTDDIDTTQNMFMRFQNNSDTSSVSGYKGVNVVASEAKDGDNAYIKAMTAIGSGVTSIEDFRTAYQVQQWLERNARGGTRYKEQILAHFGIKTKDSRLDRPEFVFGLTDVINHGNVFTTFQNENGDGVPGEAITHLTSGGRSKSVSYRVTEHGYYLTLYCLFPKAAYMHGVKRQALELDKFDYFWPEFEHLGEQEVYKCELYANDTAPMGTFGYVPRYAQYKHRDNVVRGEFVTNLPTFTLSRDWRGSNLNAKFIQIDPFINDLNRCFNVVNANYDKIYMEVYNGLYMLRPMSYYGIPRLVL